MTRILQSLFAALLVHSLLCGSTTAQQPHTLTGDIQVHKSFHSKILNNDRDIIVYLPKEYAIRKKERFSVLYLNDGQNLFDGATSFIPGQEWRVDETAEALIAAGDIEPIIVVGIYNTGQDRVDEYTPALDERIKRGGRADLYGRMLVEEVKPFIDATYRTSKDPNRTGLGGSSLGGLVSLYLGLKYPHVFTRLAIASPSVWFADKQIVKYVELLPKRPDVKIWLDIGTKEGRNAEEAERAVGATRLLRDALVKKGWRVGKDLSYLEANGAEHNERAWAERMGLILKFLFPRHL